MVRDPFGNDSEDDDDIERAWDCAVFAVMVLVWLRTIHSSSGTVHAGDIKEVRRLEDHTLFEKAPDELKNSKLAFCVVHGKEFRLRVDFFCALTEDDLHTWIKALQFITRNQLRGLSAIDACVFLVHKVGTSTSDPTHAQCSAVGV